MRIRPNYKLRPGEVRYLTRDTALTRNGENVPNIWCPIDTPLLVLELHLDSQHGDQDSYDEVDVLTPEGILATAWIECLVPQSAYVSFVPQGAYA